jgi:hypothetical protein
MGWHDGYHGKGGKARVGVVDGKARVGVMGGKARVGWDQEQHQCKWKGLTRSTRRSFCTISRSIVVDVESK